MKLKLTYQEIIDLNDALKAVGSAKSSPKFSLRIAHNRHALKNHIKFVKEGEVPSAEMIQIDKDRRDIFEKYALPVESGQLKVPNEKWPEFKAEIDAFKESNKKVTDAYDAQMKKYVELLKTQPVTGKLDKAEAVELVEIPEASLPKELNGNQLEGIFALIKLK